MNVPSSSSARIERRVKVTGELLQLAIAPSVVAAIIHEQSPHTHVIRAPSTNLTIFLWYLLPHSAAVALRNNLTSEITNFRMLTRVLAVQCAPKNSCFWYLWCIALTFTVLCQLSILNGEYQSDVGGGTECGECFSSHFRRLPFFSHSVSARMKRGGIVRSERIMKKRESGKV